MSKYLLIPLLLGLLAACRKEPVMPLEPQIVLVSMDRDSVVEFADRVVVRFSYQDGDGDLGQPDPDAYTLWVKDARLAQADGYHIPPLAPEGEEVPIQGELSVELNALFLLGNGAVETTTYTIHVEDRSGNRSNTITTGPITILPDSL